MPTERKKKVCRIDECNEPAFARRMCKKHYRRWWNETPANQRPATTDPKGRPRHEEGELLETYSFCLPPSLIRAVDAMAKQGAMSRSAVLADILRRANPDPRGEM